jgi:putative membrane fusion protein
MAGKTSKPAQGAGKASKPAPGAGKASKPAQGAGKTSKPAQGAEKAFKPAPEAGRMSKTTVTSRIVWFLVGLFFLITMASQISMRFEVPLKTEDALLYEITDSVLFKGVYIRDERQISRVTDGIVSYSNKDGSKLAINSVIAKVYSSQSDVLARQRIDELETQIKALSDAETFVGTDNSQLDAFLGQLADKHLQILRCIDSGDYEGASKYKSDYLSIQSKINVVKGLSSGYSEKIDELESEIKRLDSSITAPPKDLGISESGYFVSVVDGYETVLSYDGAFELTKEHIEDIIKNPAIEVPQNVVGKIIDSYKWRMAAVLDTEKTRGVYKGKLVDLRIGALSGSVRAVVVSAAEQKDGTTVYVFECDRLTDEFVKKRVVSVRLLLESYSGIRVPQAAVKFNEEGERGVFVLNGSVAEFRKLGASSLTREDYIIVENLGAFGYLRLYDKIIVSGKDLYDGKIVS